jgi:hypothetical protein
MTRSPYNSCLDIRAQEVRRLLDRYIVEVVEAYDLCPWSRSARLGGEVGIDVLWGTPTLDMWATCADALLATGVRVAMVVAPELACTSSELRAIRDDVSSRVKNVGVAHFHPDAPLELASPPRLVPFLRRSPDPLLQLVPLELLDSLRTGTQVVSESTLQAQMLAGTAPVPRDDVGDLIAVANHTRVTRDAVAIQATLEDIRADRERSYARVKISTSR